MKSSMVTRVKSGLFDFYEMETNIEKSVQTDLSDTKFDTQSDTKSDTKSQTAKTTRLNSISRALHRMITDASQTDADTIPPPIPGGTSGMNDIVTALKQNVKHLNRNSDTSWIRARSADSLQSSVPSENNLVLHTIPHTQQEDRQQTLQTDMIKHMETC